jgi:hypothetical protein
MKLKTRLYKALKDIIENLNRFSDKDLIPNAKAVLAEYEARERTKELLIRVERDKIKRETGRNILVACGEWVFTDDSISEIVKLNKKILAWFDDMEQDVHDGIPLFAQLRKMINDSELSGMVKASDNITASNKKP